MTRSPGRRLLTTLAAALLLLAVPQATSAHVALASSVPPDGATISEVPEPIVLAFTEALSSGSGAELRDGAGAVVALAAPDPLDPTGLLIDAPDLVPGDYEIRWTVSGSDGHIERGIVAFRYAPPPSATPSATPSVTPKPSPTAEPATPIPTASVPAETPGPTAPPGGDDGASGLDALLPIGAGLALIAILAIRLVRRGNVTR